MDALQRLTSATATGGQNGLYNESYPYNSTTGNLASKAGVNYTYDNDHPHAVSTLSNGNEYGYDANGNMITRKINNVDYTLSFDAENRMVGVSKTGLSATFVYDADGKRVQSTINNVTTKFIGNHYEVEGTTVCKYYFAGSARIAMRTGTDAPVYFLQDHLGSTSITTDSNGSLVAEMMYKAWGEVRFESTNPPTPTKYTYTGQYSNTADFGLMYYGARWYDSYINHFTQPDTIVPLETQGVQAWNRYAYVSNNPVLYNDPSGHCILCVVVGVFALVAVFAAINTDWSSSPVSTSMTTTTTSLPFSGFPTMNPTVISMLTTTPTGTLIPERLTQGSTSTPEFIFQQGQSPTPTLQPYRIDDILTNNDPLGPNVSEYLPEYLPVPVPSGGIQLIPIKVPVAIFENISLIYTAVKSIFSKIIPK